MISVDVNQNNCEYIRVGINRSDQCPRKNIKNGKYCGHHNWILKNSALPVKCSVPKCFTYTKSKIGICPTHAKNIEKYIYHSRKKHERKFKHCLIEIEKSTRDFAI